MLKEQLITIAGEEYLFTNRIGENQELLSSFNELAKHSFGISFHEVGGDYEPHVLVRNHKVCANISVNQVPFMVNGVKKLYIQLGTVMTLESERKKGLSRWLMEAIIKEWRTKCDAIYLFANDSVLDFYPKFGFVAKDEYDYRMAGVGTYFDSATGSKKVSSQPDLLHLDMSQESSYELVKEKYKEGNSFATIYMIENKGIFEFYYRGLMNENIYYIEEYDVVVTAGLEEDALICYEILGTTKASLIQILKAVAAEFDKEEIVLGFTPIDTRGFVCQLHEEEDTTLFVNRVGENPMENRRWMFPVLTHA